MSLESKNQVDIRLAAAYQGLQLWRNNNGACETADGRQIRYGLANDSAALNKRIKSSDLIGITPLLITPALYGRIIGVFTAVEAKKSNWHLTPGDERGQAQRAFHDLVREAGGFAGFARHAGELMQIIGRGNGS